MGFSVYGVANLWGTRSMGSSIGLPKGSSIYGTIYGALYGALSLWDTQSMGPSMGCFLYGAVYRANYGAVYGAMYGTLPL